MSLILIGRSLPEGRTERNHVPRFGVKKIAGKAFFKIRKNYLFVESDAVKTTTARGEKKGKKWLQQLTSQRLPFPFRRLKFHLVFNGLSFPENPIGIATEQSIAFGWLSWNSNQMDYYAIYFCSFLSFFASKVTNNIPQNSFSSFSIKLFAVHMNNYNL